MSILMNMLDRFSSGWKAWLILFLVTFTAAAPGVFNIPALDRDEARFAQASKQYIETGDYLIIRYQDEFRNKKPAGIHWLQSGSTQLWVMKINLRSGRIACRAGSGLGSQPLRLSGAV